MVTEGVAGETQNEAIKLALRDVVTALRQLAAVFSCGEMPLAKYLGSEWDQLNTVSHTIDDLTIAIDRIP
jgi:hypothetical protein